MPNSGHRAARERAVKGLACKCMLTQVGLRKPCHLAEHDIGSLRLRARSGPAVRPSWASLGGLRKRLGLQRCEASVPPDHAHTPVERAVAAEKSCDKR